MSSAPLQRVVPVFTLLLLCLGTGCRTTTAGGDGGSGGSGGDGGDGDCAGECQADQIRCDADDQPATCVAGCWQPSEPCAEGTLCVNGRCDPVVCAPGEPESCTSETVLLRCNPDGTGFVLETCSFGYLCADEGCYDPHHCSLDDLRCLDADTVESCDADGDWVVSHDCGQGEICVTGICEDDCEAGDLRCASDSESEICDEASTWIANDTCEAGETCVAGVCSVGCVPSQEFCESVDTVKTCSGDGTQWIMTDCPSGTVCDTGACVTLCEASDKIKTYIGCEYWAADLRNDGRPCSSCDSGLSAAEHPYALVVSNPNADFAAEITIRNGSGAQMMLPEGNLVPPLGVTAYLLPMLNVDGSGVSSHSYHLTSTVPVMAHQFNPANNVDVFSNDASLLLPTNALGNDYLLLAWPGLYNSSTSLVLQTYATIIATVDQTEVEITTPVGIAAGTDFAALAAGESRTLTLDRFEVLNLEAAAIDGIDPTGLQITATHPIAVFYGNACAQVPVGTDYCDHIEQQMYPVDTWGTSYVAGKSFPRGEEPDIWRIFAAEDGTFVQTYPWQDAAGGMNLDRGEFWEIASNESFEILADKPIAVGQYLVGSNFDDGDAIDYNSWDGVWCRIGDPAYLLNVSTAQYRTDYVVLTPEDYVLDFLAIIAPAGSAILLDDSTIAADGATVLRDGLALPTAEATVEPVGTGAYDLFRIEVEDGAHVVTADQPFGLTAYGFDCDVSYAYPGGLNLESL